MWCDRPIASVAFGFYLASDALAFCMGITMRTLLCLTVLLLGSICAPAASAYDYLSALAQIGLAENARAETEPVVSGAWGRYEIDVDWHWALGMELSALPPSEETDAAANELQDGANDLAFARYQCLEPAEYEHWNADWLLDFAYEYLAVGNYDSAVSDASSAVLHYTLSGGYANAAGPHINAAEAHFATVEQMIADIQNGGGAPGM